MCSCGLVLIDEPVERELPILILSVSAVDVLWCLGTANWPSSLCHTLLFMSAIVLNNHLKALSMSSRVETGLEGD